MYLRINAAIIAVKELHNQHSYNNVEEKHYLKQNKMSQFRTGSGS